MPATSQAVGSSLDESENLVVCIDPGLYKKKAESGYPEVFLPKSDYSETFPKQSYTITSNYQRGSQITLHQIQFNQAGNYTINLTYSTGWTCYLTVQFYHNGSTQTLLTTANTGTSGSPTYTLDCSVGDRFILRQCTDSENAGNRYVNCTYTVIKNS